MNKLLVICGPTATGKTDLGIHLAKKFAGEIISADSRQVYQGMDIVTGKDLPVNSKFQIPNSKLRIKNNNFTVGYRFKNEIPIWLVDIVGPNYQFNVGEYSKIAKRVIDNIRKRNKLPIIVGGTGLYIKSLLNPLSFVDIPPNQTLRKKINTLTKFELQREFSRLDRSWWERMNNSDKNNPRRLIRAIEIEQYLKKNNTPMNRFIGVKADMLTIGLKAPKEILIDRINKRVDQRIREGALEEITNLIKEGYSWDLTSFSSTGIRQLRSYFEKKESLVAALNKWKLAEIQYAKRQITWFKKSLKLSKGHWFDITDENYISKIEDLVEKWYTLS